MCLSCLKMLQFKVDGGASSLVLWTTLCVRMLTKVTKHSKNKLQQRNKLEYNSFLPRIIRNKTLPTYHLLWGACHYLTPFYLIVMDCWKYCKGYKFALSIARPRAKKLSASGGFTLTRGSAPGPHCPQTRYRLALAMCPPKLLLVSVLWRRRLDFLNVCELSTERNTVIEAYMLLAISLL